MEIRSFQILGPIIYLCITLTKHLTETADKKKGFLEDRVPGVLASAMVEGWGVYDSKGMEQRHVTG